MENITQDTILECLHIVFLAYWSVASPKAAVIDLGEFCILLSFGRWEICEVSYCLNDLAENFHDCILCELEL